jgi:DNA-binding NtrC family response regulator
MQKILISTKNSKIADAICNGFPLAHQSDVAGEISDVYKRIQSNNYDFLFIDVEILSRMAAETEISGNFGVPLQKLKKYRPFLGIILIAPPSKIREAVRFVKNGASNYLTCPIDPAEVQLVIEEIIEDRRQKSELAYLRNEFRQADSLIVDETRSPIMRRVFDDLRSVATTKTTVLLMGDTGTGKNVLAKFIHRHSSRKDGRFINVHCGAIPDTLIESELFGHEKGAFTGAVRRKLGKFEIAAGGTIFLDEIGTITPAAQIKLLTVLQEGIFQRLGSEQTLKADVRVVTATNADLKKMCEDNLFRKDLYYRLNVFPVVVPFLSQRMEDIPLFADLFLDKLNKFNGKDIKGFQPGVMDALLNYGWPGNIRELENLIERAYILEPSTVLTPGSFPAELFENHPMTAEVPINASVTLAETRRQGTAEIEKQYLASLLTRNQGKINRSALEAGISTRQLNKLMNRYNLRKENFKHR